MLRRPFGFLILLASSTEVMTWVSRSSLRLDGSRDSFSRVSSLKENVTLLASMEKIAMSPLGAGSVSPIPNHRSSPTSGILMSSRQSESLGSFGAQKIDFTSRISATGVGAFSCSISACVFSGSGSAGGSPVQSKPSIAGLMSLL